jgi:hypothetical protein
MLLLYSLDVRIWAVEARWAQLGPVLRGLARDLQPCAGLPPSSPANLARKRLAMWGSLSLANNVGGPRVSPRAKMFIYRMPAPIDRRKAPSTNFVGRFMPEVR